MNRNKYTDWFWPLAVFLILLVVFSCARQKYDLDQIRLRAEAFDREITLSWYETDNYGRTSQISEIYDRYQDLFTDQELVRFVGAEMERQTEPAQRRRLTYLRGYLIDEFIGLKVGSLDDQVLNLQAQETLPLPDQNLAFRDVYGELYNSSDREWRRQVYQAQRDFICQRINPLLTERLKVQRQTIRQFGFKDYVDFQDQMHQSDFDNLSQLCEELLYQTELIYRRLLEETAEKTLGLPLHQIHVYDRPRLFRGQSFDAYFPKDRMVPLVRETLADMGFQLDQQDNIDVDVEDRPEKEPRPACYIISVPDDIRVLVKPMGGAEDYESLFHEMGHAQHYAHVVVPEFEFRVLGGDGVTETYAFLFENLFMDDVYLIERAGLPENRARSYLRQALLADLSSLRYYCALFLFEQQLHAGLEKPWQVYRDLWERARLTRMNLPEAEGDYLMANENFYSVGYLEAWLLEAQLRETLRDRHGPQWFSDPRAGRLVEDLWAWGSQKSVVELSRELGYEKLDAAALRRQVERIYHLTEPAASTEPAVSTESDASIESTVPAEPAVSL
jgi:oligoendopeptidase F